MQIERNIEFFGGLENGLKEIVIEEVIFDSVVYQSFDEFEVLNVVLKFFVCSSWVCYWKCCKVSEMVGVCFDEIMQFIVYFYVCVQVKCNGIVNMIYNL